MVPSHCFASPTPWTRAGRRGSDANPGATDSASQVVPTGRPGGDGGRDALHSSRRLLARTPRISTDRIDRLDDCSDGFLDPVPMVTPPSSPVRTRRLVAQSSHTGWLIA